MELTSEAIPSHYASDYDEVWELINLVNGDYHIAELVAVLETQIDDLSPQTIGYLIEQLLRAGALDTFVQPVGMKKSRPGMLITVICHSDRIADCQEILFRETTTLGIRQRLQERLILPRTICQVETAYGRARVKIARRGQLNFTVQPEYEDCASLARQSQLPLGQIQNAVRVAGELLVNQILKNRELNE